MSFQPGLEHDYHSRMPANQEVAPPCGVRTSNTTRLGLSSPDIQIVGTGWGSHWKASPVPPPKNWTWKLVKSSPGPRTLLSPDAQKPGHQNCIPWGAPPPHGGGEVGRGSVKKKRNQAGEERRRGPRVTRPQWAGKGPPPPHQQGHSIRAGGCSKPKDRSGHHQRPKFPCLGFPSVCIRALPPGCTLGPGSSSAWGSRKPAGEG